MDPCAISVHHRLKLMEIKLEYLEKLIIERMLKLEKEIQEDLKKRLDKK